MSQNENLHVLHTAFDEHVEQIVEAQVWHFIMQFVQPGSPHSVQVGRGRESPHTEHCMLSLGRAA